MWYLISNVNLHLTWQSAWERAFQRWKIESLPNSSIHFPDTQLVQACWIQQKLPPSQIRQAERVLLHFHPPNSSRYPKQHDEFLFIITVERTWKRLASIPSVQLKQRDSIYFPIKRWIPCTSSLSIISIVRASCQRNYSIVSHDCIGSSNRKGWNVGFSVWLRWLHWYVCLNYCLNP